MENDEKPAYPVLDQDYKYVDGRLMLKHPGMTKREVFAKDAPQEIPDWFEFKDPSLKHPVGPTFKNLSPEDDRTVRDWIKDPSYDLDEHLQWFQMAWEQYLEDRFQYENQLKIDKYFAWRVYYADMLLSQLAKS